MKRVSATDHTQSAVEVRHPAGGGHVPSLSLSVLASGSTGNCSVLMVEGSGRREVWLIDCGLSRRRVLAGLRSLGLEDVAVAGLILTHLDDDHANATTIENLSDVPVFVHRRHLRRAEREGRLYRRTELYTDQQNLSDLLSLAVCHAPHDAHGSAVLRFELRPGPLRCSVGYATDVGRVSDEIVGHLHGVDTLAIESNYCPRLQAASPRPEVLKRRITGGKGHLSNEQSARAVQRIAPREHLVLLHLSQQCNRPELAAAAHAGAPCPLTISGATEPTAWLRSQARHRSAEPARIPNSLFEVTLPNVAGDREPGSAGPPLAR